MDLKVKTGTKTLLGLFAILLVSFCAFTLVYFTAAAYSPAHGKILPGYIPIVDPGPHPVSESPKIAPPETLDEDPLIKNLRTEKGWEKDEWCITNLDAKFISKSSLPEVKKMVSSGKLHVVINQRLGGFWGNARAFGVDVHSHIDDLTKRYNVLVKMIDLTIPLNVNIVVEWWDQFSFYRITFYDDKGKAQTREFTQEMEGKFRKAPVLQKALE